MLWIFFAIAAPAFYGISNLFDKFLIEKKIHDPILLTIFGGIVVFVAGSIIFAIRGFGILAGWQIAVLLVSGALGEIALVPYYKALSLDDTSRIMPFFQVGPVFVFILSFFILGETLKQRQLLAFLLILAGSFILSIENFDMSLFRIRRSFWYAMFASFLWATPYVIFKLVAIRQGFWETCAYELMGNALGAALLFLFYRRRFLKELRLVTPGAWGIINANEGIFFIGRLCGFYAVALGSVSLVSVLGGLNPLFVFSFGLILSFWFPRIIKEDISRFTITLKIIAITLVFAGVWFINS